ncbi:MAG: DNA-binding transcriptional regulator [Calditrichaceae bacterium]|nr:DNA-binding transcriptional regulator [Calditrichaceae bacterium]MBN2708156.1 DNA-binding transcriptional regulator [Calditrichaceae bacterium]RQV94832.1 MAG: DNA-binding transcriptional regulator [Calditrichota bacterium]
MKRIILLLETSRAFGRQLITGIARYSRLHGPWSFYKEPTDLKSSIPHLTNWNPDGIIMRDSLITTELLKLRIPTILAIHDSKYPKNLPVIKTDSHSIARMASDHLLEKGLRNFAYCGFDYYDWSEERKQYFNQFNKEAGFTTYNFISPKSNRRGNWENEQEHVSKWIKSLPKPIGVFACNDDRGQHILEVCKTLNLKVPEEVAVIGVDNDPLVCDIGDPPLTSIALNVESAGYRAASLMDYMISAKKASRRHILVSPTHVVQRQSSDILAVNDPEVAQAINYIRQNAKNKILVKDVVQTTCLSRRTLERRFKNAIHRSIYGEIRRVRIELISKMLIDTDLSISQISALFNFTDTEHISRYFKIEKGIGLREFRKLHQSC